MLTVFFLTWTSRAYTYTHTHTPSFEELISFFLLYPPLPPPIIRTVDGKEEAESPKRSQNGRGGTVGRAGWRKLLVGSGAGKKRGPSKEVTQSRGDLKRGWVTAQHCSIRGKR